MKADTLILGNIITMDDIKPRAEAMAVKDGKILYVGTERMARKLCDDKAEVLDYGKNYVYPGFMDAHCHGMWAGWRAIGIADLFEGESYEDYFAIMKKYINDNPGKDFYIGSGWIEKQEGAFTKEELDAIAPDVPVVMHSNDGHSMLANTKALEKYGYTVEVAKKMNPGEAEFNEAGELNGIFHETPVKEFMNKVDMTMDEMKSYILEWQNLAFSRGYTAHAEAGSMLVNKAQNDAYTEVANEGKLKLRTYSYHTIADNTDTPEEDIENTWKLVQKHNNEYHKIIGLKTFLDGVLEARTAWMKDEYHDEPGYYGVSCFNDHDKMTRLIKAAAKYNLEVHCHTMGDGAAKFILDCIEEAQAETGNMNQQNCLAHLQFVTPEDIKRFAETNTVAVTAPTWTMKYEDNYVNAVKFVGKDILEDEYPIKSFHDAGVLTVTHSDYSAGPFLEVPLSIFMACNRYHPLLGKESQNNVKECVTRKQALEMMTKNIAKQFREEDRLGTLEIGKIANASVFDVDFLTASDEAVAEAKVVATVIDGDEVFKA